MDQTEEREIIEAIQGGDIQGYALLVEQYGSAVFNLAFRMTGSRQDADDLAQETFLRAFTFLSRFDRQRRFFPWLYTIALNLIRKHLKKKREIPMEPVVAEPGDDPEQTLTRIQEARWLSLHLDRLPVHLREAVVLRYYEDLPFEEIADITGVSTSGAKMRVYRGLERLRVLISEDEGPDGRAEG
ncbi:MAG: sigma-70 family RNA polymerase sigma factor [Proteobacteria bacterium]|nr:sigma-70 family RNA polymerase sigma factor [Pseudomonadota bacterium]